MIALAFTFHSQCECGIFKFNGGSRQQLTHDTKDSPAIAVLQPSRDIFKCIVLTVAPYSDIPLLQYNT